jgi:hypothetical protein
MPENFFDEFNWASKPIKSKTLLVEEPERNLNSRFREVLRKEKKVASWLVGTYENSKKTDKKTWQSKIEEFRDLYKKRRKLQREILRKDFIEDERIQFGCEKVLSCKEEDYNSKVEKYLLLIAKAIKISEDESKNQI